MWVAAEKEGLLIRLRRNERGVVEFELGERW